mmetsp:Transcript_41537/g.103251  ORF Transcript_41537/g.103251 Transcript_41537/m.103251 type:complete len:330 (-) Transcript_41537:613-1602(-)
MHRVQSGVPRPHLHAEARLVPRQPARGLRVGAQLHADHIATQARGGGRGPRGPRLRDSRGAARARRHSLRGVAPDRRAVQPRQASPRQGGVLRDLAVLRRGAQAEWGGRAPLHEGGRVGAGGRWVRQGRAGDGGGAAHARHRRRGSRQGGLVHRRPHPRQAGRREGGDRRRRRHRLRRGGVRRPPRGRGAPRGRRHDAGAVAGAVVIPPRLARRPDQLGEGRPPRGRGGGGPTTRETAARDPAAAAQERQARRGPGADDRVDPPRVAQEDGRDDARRAHVREGRRRRPAREGQGGEAAHLRGGHGDRVRGAGIGGLVGSAAQGAGGAGV